MALILAIEPDKKQASAVRALARGSLNAEMLVADSTAHGLHQLDGRVPDLILTSLLLSPKDESALDTHLRALDAEGHRVPTLVIPCSARSADAQKAACSPDSRSRRRRQAPRAAIPKHSPSRSRSISIAPRRSARSTRTKTTTSCQSPPVRGRRRFVLKSALPRQSRTTRPSRGRGGIGLRPNLDVRAG